MTNGRCISMSTEQHSFQQWRRWSHTHSYIELVSVAGTRYHRTLMITIIFSYFFTFSTVDGHRHCFIRHINGVNWSFTNLFGILSLLTNYKWITALIVYVGRRHSDFGRTTYFGFKLCASRVCEEETKRMKWSCWSKKRKLKINFNCEQK